MLKRKCIVIFLWLVDFLFFLLNSDTTYHQLTTLNQNKKYNIASRSPKKVFFSFSLSYLVFFVLFFSIATFPVCQQEGKQKDGSRWGKTQHK